MTTVNPFYFDQATGVWRPHDPLYTATADGVCATLATDTSIIGTGVGTLTIPANYFATNKTLRVSAAGFYTIKVADTANTLLIRLWKGGIGGTNLAQGSITGLTTIEGNQWQFMIDITGRSATSVIAQGLFMMQDDTDTRLLHNIGVQSGTVAVAINSTAEAFALSANLTNNAALTSNVTCTNFTLAVV